MFLENRSNKMRGEIQGGRRVIKEILVSFFFLIPQFFLLWLLLRNDKETESEDKRLQERHSPFNSSGGKDGEWCGRS